MNHVDKLKSKLSSISKMRKPAYEIEQTYVDSIYQIDLSSEIDANEIVNSIYKYKEKYPISNTSNIVAWHSDYDTHHNTSDFDLLLNSILDKLNDIQQFTNGKSNIQIAEHIVITSWVGIYNKTNYTKWHNHGWANWATVYYAKAEESCAPIVFDKLEIIPKTNMLLIFPGRLRHMVKKSESDNERIIFAANFGTTFLKK